MTAGRVVVTYEAVADPDGSINTTSNGKTNFWDYVKSLLAYSWIPDAGLAGTSMPGPANSPQPMTFESGPAQIHGNRHTNHSGRRRRAEELLSDVQGDGARLGRRCAGGNEHRGAGFRRDDVPRLSRLRLFPGRPSRRGVGVRRRSGARLPLNILRKHDETQAGKELFSSALARNSYNAAGLYAPRQRTTGKPVLCANCHLSNALPGLGVDGVPPLTRAVHGAHAGVADPETGVTLDSASNRDACYRCHPGSSTRLPARRHG